MDRQLSAAAADVSRDHVFRSRLTVTSALVRIPPFRVRAELCSCRFFRAEFLTLLRIAWL